MSSFVLSPSFDQTHLNIMFEASSEVVVGAFFQAQTFGFSQFSNTLSGMSNSFLN